jgi:hypothetical protein
MVSKIFTVALAATAILGGAATANAAGFVQSPRASGTIERSAAPANVDVTPTGSVENSTAGGQVVTPYNHHVGVKSYHIQSITPYDGR